ncbi:unnamed protein product [Effrenium voratum]|nr:unnamed protein product [Effrenium voratum]
MWRVDSCPVAFGRKKKDPGAAKAKAKAPASHFEPPASPEAVSASPKQSATTGRPKVFLEIAIFRGAFFGVDHQQSLEFELFPEVAPKAVRRLLEDCAALRLRDRRLQVTQSLATLEGGDLGEPQAETGCGMKHTEPGMLSVARGADFAGYLLTLAPLPRLDREHRAFGRLVQGEAFLQHIRDAHNSECKEVRVVNCGEVLRGLNPSRSRSRSRQKVGRPWPPMAAPSAAAAAGAAAAALLQRQLPGGEGWSEHQTGDGRKFFHNEDTGVSQWEKPESLMSEGEKLVNSTAWKQYRIWDGRIFYHNKETKVSCWSMPPDLRKLRGESTGLDDRPLPDTSTERRNAFQEFLEERIDASWDWRRVQQVAQSAPQASGVSEQVQRQVFAELLSMALRKSEAQARAKARNAAVALERLIEERFSDPDALGTSYEEAARILGDEEAWTLIKSEVRRDEVFQNVMERLEDKHQRARAEKRTARVVRLQRLMATDPDLKRARTRWKDAAAVLARRDELQEEDPPMEAMRVWTSMRELRLASAKDIDLKSKVQNEFYRDERKRRDAFVLAMKEQAAAERFTMHTSWAQLVCIVLVFLAHACAQKQVDARKDELRLFDEFLEELKLKGPEAYAGVEPAPPPAVQAGAAGACYAPPTGPHGFAFATGVLHGDGLRAVGFRTRLSFGFCGVEVHVHLDGSFDSEVLFRAAQKHLEELPVQVRTPWDGKMLEVREAIRKCKDLAQFKSLVTVGKDVLGLFPILDCFYVFLPIVRGRFEVLEELSYEFCRERKAQNIIYTEVRYSPFEFLKQCEDGIADESQAEEAVKAVCCGLERGQKDFGVLVRQILCCIAAQPSWSQKTAQLAVQYAERGVVGLDIASGEMHFEDAALQAAHRQATDLAKHALGVTVHAAEAGPGGNVQQALDLYSASRIGHGYRCLDTEAYEAAKAKGTHFELCPSSSVSTQAVQLKHWSEHPIRRFFQDRTSCSINSDDPAIFQCSLTDELALCLEMGLTLQDLRWMTLEALKHSFNLEAHLKESLAETVTAFYDRQTGA